VVVMLIKLLSPPLSDEEMTLNLPQLTVQRSAKKNDYHPLIGCRTNLYLHITYIIKIVCICLIEIISSIIVYKNIVIFELLSVEEELLALIDKQRGPVNAVRKQIAEDSASQKQEALDKLSRNLNEFNRLAAITELPRRPVSGISTLLTILANFQKN